MSRRAPNPAAERAAQNQATIKNLLKLEANKTCADCKRNKHPRWASWNLGIFICIRCSGIHRGMGTHISRVKSVDLDSWTDEQLQSVVNWGNARANKYWEAKLAAGHAPSEGKIENFIRTKYELKRWTMDGPIPDPAALDGDDDILPTRVKERQAAEPTRRTPVGQSSISRPPAAAAAPVVDLIGGVDPLPQQRTGPAAAKIPPKADPAPPKATGTKDSLLGLDFFGPGSAPQRPASTTGVGAGSQSRPDLKQSILSLYATAPKTQPPPQQHQQQHNHHHQQQQQQQQQHGGFGGMGHRHSGSSGGFSDAFGNLSMGSGATSPGKPAPADPFASLGSAARNSPNRSSFGGLGGGSFFDSRPPTHQSKLSNSSFGAYSSPTQAPAPAPAKPSSAMDDLFDFSATATTTTNTTTSPTQPMSQISAPHPGTVFNLSSPKAATTASALGGANLSGADVWGASDWTIGTTSSISATTTTTTSTATATAGMPSFKRAEPPKTSSMGWGSSGGAFAATPIVPGSSGGFNPAPKVAADEEFGGWTSSAGPATSGVATTTTKAFGEDSNDLFNNVWQ